MPVSFMLDINFISQIVIFAFILAGEYFAVFASSQMC